jgi:hypothetical protein
MYINYRKQQSLKYKYKYTILTIFELNNKIKDGKNIKNIKMPDKSISFVWGRKNLYWSITRLLNVIIKHNVELLEYDKTT